MVQHLAFRSRPMSGLRQGKASAVPKSSENSGVLTPEAGTILGKGSYKIGSSRKRLSLSFRGAPRRACLPQAGNLHFLLKEIAFA